MILNIIIAFLAIAFVVFFVANRIIKIKKHGISSLCGGNCAGCSKGCNKKGS